MQNVEVGFNLVSLGPYVGVRPPFIGPVLGNFGVSLKQKGVEFVSIGPYRCVWDYSHGNNKYTDVPPVKYYEDAWNPTESNGWLAGAKEVMEKRKDPRGPKIHDLIVFPGIETVNARMVRIAKTFPQAEAIVHSMNELSQPFVAYDSYAAVCPNNPVSVLYEVSPGPGLGIDEINEGIQEYRNTHKDTRFPIASGVVVDTKHIREGMNEFQTAISLPGTPTQPLPTDWHQTIEGLVNETVLIDFQAMDLTELYATLNHTEGTELNEMMACIDETGYEGPVRMEIQLNKIDYLNPNNIIEVAGAAHDYIVDTLKD